MTSSILPGGSNPPSDTSKGPEGRDGEHWDGALCAKRPIFDLAADLPSHIPEKLLTPLPGEPRCVEKPHGR
jgi:hypothetical protein